MISPVPSFLFRFSACSAKAGKLSCVLSAVLALTLASHVKADTAILKYHVCGIQCDQYTGQDFAGLGLQTSVTGSFPPGDYDIEYNHPEGWTEKFYIQYFNGQLYGGDQTARTYYAGDLLGTRRTLSVTGRVFFHATNTLATNVFVTYTEDGVVQGEVACDCESGIGKSPRARVTLSGVRLGSNYIRSYDAKRGGDQCQKPEAPLPAMARYSAHSMLASLNIDDTPFRYTPARGPAINFTVTYNQKDTAQPQTFTYSNLGPNWTFNWLSYIAEDPNSALRPSLYIPGGGTEVYSLDQTTGKSAVDPQSHAVLIKSGGNYERDLPDGSKEFYTSRSSASHYPVRVFMTSVCDPTGNCVSLSYDATFRITALTDALGYVTTPLYEDNNNPLRVTGVREPSQFGTRRATFAYDGSGRLQSITDEIGIQSQFTYSGNTTFIDSLQTPYGTSHFSSGETSGTRWIELTDPAASKERLEYRDNTTGFGANEPVPAGITNAGLAGNNTFYWDKKAYSSPTDDSKARVTHWAKNADETVSSIVASEKAPLENRVWYTYSGQTDSNHAGTIANPSQVARVLDDSTTQLWQYEYNNSFGKMTKSTDPIGRVMTYSYDSNNNIDLLTVRQSTGSNNELLRSLSYNTMHEPLTDKDAAGQTTTYTYRADGHGQIQTVQNAKLETTTYSYGPATNVPANYLASIASPPFNGASAVTSVTYDSVNRVRTVTSEADSYTVTTDYDNLDRPTQIAYPDGTTQQFQYSQDFGQGLTTILDLTKSKDRRDRWTTRHYNANRQMDSITEPFDVSTRTTFYGWCNCGALTSITDPRGSYPGDPAHTTTFVRDLQSRVYQKRFADGTSINYLYEGQTAANTAGATSRLKSMTDALNQTTTYGYFADDDLKQITYTNAVHTTPNVSFLYDPNYNRLTSMTDGTGTTTYSYYQITATPPLGAGQLQTVDGPLANDAITYGYDELERVVSRSVNGVASSVTYDSLGRLDASDNILGHFSRVYDAAAHVTPRLQTLTLPNGQTANYSYFDNSQDRRLQTLQDLTSGSANISKFDYANYDKEGQVKDWTKTLGRSAAIASSHTYDLGDQLTGVTNTTAGNPSTSFSYTYDLAGNRTSDSVTPVYTIDNVNQITNTGYTHDVDGNMTNDGVHGFEWDAANRLTAIVYPGDAGRSEFSYDGLGRRVQIVEKDGYGSVQRTSKFVWDGMTIAEERDKYNNVVKRFLPEGVQVLANASPNSKLFYSRDHLGSVRSLTNETGTLLSTVDYDSYGSISRPPVPANTTSGGPVITAAESQLTHGSAGMFAIPLPLSGAPGIEMRTQGGTYTLMLTFDRPVVSGTATMASGVGTVNGVPTFSGNTATVQLSAVANRQTITVELDNVVGVTGVTDKVLVAMSVLVGDVNQDGAVTGIDSDLVRSSSGASVTTATFKKDVTANGFINSGDFSATGTSVYQGAALFPDFAFTGHYYHARSGLYLAPYRAYNPSIGRWISRDPLRNAEMGQGPNLYAYVQNDPISRIDSLGLEVRAYNSAGWGIPFISHVFFWSTTENSGVGRSGSWAIAYGSGVPDNFRVGSPDYSNYTVVQLPPGMTDLQFLNLVKEDPNLNTGGFVPYKQDCHNSLMKTAEDAGATVQDPAPRIDWPLFAVNLLSWLAGVHDD
jgi:RHS repeat-associated protein